MSLNLELIKEEEIRGKLLLPFLNDLGFDLSEISLEKSFNIRLGKSVRAINGRADILCKANGKNLFIIELKNDSISIDQNDIDQGISYARALLDDIAPFTIITNGKTTRIFDSVSRIELTGKKISEESDFWKNDYTLSIDKELRIRYEALKKFISFSPENLKLFCENQVKDRMGTLLGNINTPSSKFVKELYFQRQDLVNAFNSFINSEAKFFGIVGSAGVGKTNIMCSLAIQSLEDKFVFFYNASIINKSPLEHIAQDLNGVFSSKSESNLVLKRLDELGRSLNKNIVIFIDAIDESTDSNISLELSEIALACKNLDKIKICISCKSNIWSNILNVNGNNTHLFEELDKFSYTTNKLNGFPWFLLEDFNDDELKNIIPLYKDAFKFKGEISKSLIKELKNGFFLRIFSEVYCGKKVPEKINDKELIKTYIKQSLEKTKLGGQAGLRILSKIGKVLMNHHYTSLEAHKDEGLDINNLLEKLDFSIEENLPEDLFARNILIKSNKDDSYNVPFYYSKIRDYVICFHSFKLDQLNDNEFYNVLEEFYQNYIGQSAIEFYIKNAGISHRHMFVKFKKNRAHQYVINYDSYLEENFKNSKKLFEPKTEGKIGIILPDDLLNEDGYALCHIDSNSSTKIYYQSFKDPFSEPEENNFFLQNGAYTVHGGTKSLLISDQNKIVKQNIFKQLDKIIKKGELVTYNSDTLLLEQVSTIFYYYFKNLGYNIKFENYYIPRFDLIYPINLKELRDRIYIFLATHHYERYFPPNLIKGKVEEALKKNIDIPRLNTIGDVVPFDELFNIVNILLERGYSIILNHHLPYPDKSIVETNAFHEQNRGQLNKVRVFQYSEYQAKLYVESFFKHLECAYKEFVEYFFPTFKDQFHFYNTIPHDYFFYMRESDILTWGMFGYRSSKNGQINFYIKDDSKREDAFKKEGISILRAFSLNAILHNEGSDKIQTIPKIKTRKVDEFCVIRSWIYKLLRKDLENIFKENKE